PAIPLWINGRPVLAMPLEFNEIREAATQRLIRRVPMIDAGLAASAIVCANQSQQFAPESVNSFLTALLQALEELEDHFAGLSAVESHTHLDSGKADVANAISSVRVLLEKPLSPTYKADQSVLALSGPGMPLSAAVSLVLPVVINGGAVTLVPDANAPSCALALTELCGQCGLPDGLFNVVYVRDPVALQLASEPGVERVRLFGPSAWAQRWQTAAMDWKTPCELVLA
ncbi:MAG: aldehyde dehydrogenase family protein, partial [Fluviibacter sp.]